MIAMHTILDLSQSSTILKFLQRIVKTLGIPLDNFPYRFVNKVEPELVVHSPQSS